MIIDNMDHSNKFINNRRFFMSQKDCQNFLVGLLIIFGVISLFSVLAFMTAMIAMLK